MLELKGLEPTLLSWKRCFKSKATSEQKLDLTRQTVMLVKDTVIKARPLCISTLRIKLQVDLSHFQY